MSYQQQHNMLSIAQHYKHTHHYVASYTHSSAQAIIGKTQIMEITCETESRQQQHKHNNKFVTRNNSRQTKFCCRAKLLSFREEKENSFPTPKNESLCYYLVCCECKEKNIAGGIKNEFKDVEMFQEPVSKCKRRTVASTDKSKT